MFRVSSQGISFISSFEGFRALPYKDSGGLSSIGYGQRINDDLVAKYKGGITIAQAQGLLATYIASECAQLDDLPFGQLLQHQQDAIASFAYNCGIRTLVASRFYKQIVARGDDLSDWIHYIHDAKGNIQDGLIKRRAKELQLFIYAQY